MLRPLMASALVLSLILSTVSATPAHADRDDFAKFLGGVIVLYGIGRALEDRSQSTRVQRHTPV